MRLPIQLIAVLLLAFAVLLSQSAHTQPKADKEAYVLVGAGDIAWCGGDGAERTATLIDQVQPDAVFTLGDNAYENRTEAEFEECYEPTWGRFKDTTYPAVGNHDYGVRATRTRTVPPTTLLLTSTTSVRGPVSSKRVSTLTILGSGTSWFSTPCAVSWGGASKARRRWSG